MNKTELIAEVSKKTGMSKKDAERAVNAAVDAITEALVSGDKVQLKPSSAKPAWAATPKPRSPLKSPPPRFPYSKPARL